MFINKIGAWLLRAHKARRLRQTRIPEYRWRDTLEQVDILRQLSKSEQHRLRELTGQFLQVKTFNGAHDFVVNDEMRTLIAAQACLLILELDIHYFDGWYEVIVYPDPFIVRRDVMGEEGIVHATQQVLGGEAWGRGPVILSWADARPGARPHGEGSNVILHEFAHKLDMLNGAANGMPPLHHDMSHQAWTQVFQQAYDQLLEDLANRHRTGIDPYASENPAEFFAVMTETFFEAPQRLLRFQPALYTQLQQFYRQDPLRRSG